MTDDSARLVLVDVGSSGGLEPKWHPYADRLDFVMFEPNPTAAADLRKNPQHTTVVEAALSSRVGRRRLFVTANPLCISLHRPNVDIVASYDHHEHFQILEELEVDCTRYDILYREERVPQPDIIKIDTQGHEFEVLVGFGHLLQDCLGIELESHLYPLYEGQKLLGDIVQLLAAYGFVLRRLEPADSFHGDFVEAEAYFTLNRERTRALSAERRAKAILMNEIWKLPNYAE